MSAKNTRKNNDRYKKSIELLNKVIADELTAVHQYMYLHFHLDDQGFDLLAQLFKRTAIEEMIHIERVAERILFLKGEVEMTASGTVKKIHDAAEMLALVSEMEQQNISDYNAWALECAAAGDSASRKLLEDLVADEERHFSQFDNEADNLSRFGDKYLALQSIERSKAALVPAAPPGGADKP